MKILSLDSATESATCAVLDGSKVLGEITFNYKKQYSVILMNMVDFLLKNLNLCIKEIDGFVVSKGPGSFTGLRIGAATIKGLSQGCNKPFISISSLDALAYNLAYTDGIICPILDALRDNVYTAIYKFNNNTLEKIEDYSVINIDDLINKLKTFNEKVTFIGDGVDKFKENILQNLNNSYFAPTHLNLVKASSLGELGLSLLNSGVEDNVYTFAPLYLRQSQAEREYEKKNGCSVYDE